MTYPDGSQIHVGDLIWWAASIALVVIVRHTRNILTRLRPQPR